MPRDHGDRPTFRVKAFLGKLHAEIKASGAVYLIPSPLMRVLEEEYL